VAGGEVALLDTSILIDILDRGNTKLYLNLQDKYEKLVIPIIALYEYLYGYKVLRKNIEEAKKYLEKIFDIEYIDQNVILEIINLDYNLRSKGIKIPDRDLIMAGIAKNKNYTIITKNIKHFKQLTNYGVKIHLIK